MFQQLATYLSQYKQVAIPGVGSFELVQQPATLDVASSINAQGDAFKNTSASEVNTTSAAANSISIITPWNTGNERNNNATNSTG